MLKRSLFLFFFGLSLFFSLGGQATASSSPPPTIEARKLLVPPKGPSALPSFYKDPIGWALGMQRTLSKEMSSYLRQLKKEGSLHVLFVLSLISFSYGVIHALGPGHGKAVVSLWVLGQRKNLGDGIRLAFLSSALQGLVAIGSVSFFVILLRWSPLSLKDLAFTLEKISFLGISAIGLFLCFSALKTRFYGPSSSSSCSCGHHHYAPPLPVFTKTTPSQWHWCAPALSVGIRPCLGALLILMASYGLGLYWAGIVAVLAMAFGTALTVSGLVFLSVVFKDRLLRAFSTSSSLAWVYCALTFGSGSLLFFLGMGMFLRAREMGSLPF